MDTILIVIHLMVVVALIAVVLLQRSEGGALGMGGGGGGGFMSARGSANVLTRLTAILAAAFFATSLTLGIMAKNKEGSGSILDRVPVSNESSEKGGEGGILDALPETKVDVQTDQDAAETDANGVPTGDGSQAPASGDDAAKPEAGGSDAGTAEESAPQGSTSETGEPAVPNN